MNGFWDSLWFFREAFIGTAGLSVLLSVIGVVLLMRQEVFWGLAVGQASVFGVALALATAGGHSMGLNSHVHSLYPVVGSVLFSLLAAAGLEGLARRREGRETASGFLFLLFTAGAMSVVSRSPLGLEEVQRLFSSSVLSIGWKEALTYGLAALLAPLVIWRLKRILLLVSLDPAGARAIGIRENYWNAGISAISALIIAIAIRSAGTFFVFSSLLIPALAASRTAGSFTSLLVMSPLLALLFAVGGSAISLSLDLPPAFAITLLGGFFYLVVLMVASWFRSRPRERRMRATNPARLVLPPDNAPARRAPPPADA